MKQGRNRCLRLVDVRLRASRPPDVEHHQSPGRRSWRCSITSIVTRILAVRAPD